MIDRAAAERMQSRKTSLYETISRVRARSEKAFSDNKEPNKPSVNIEAYIAQIENVWESMDHYVNNGSLVETQGFFLHSVARLFPDDIITPMEDVIRKAVDEYCGSDGSYFSVYKMPSTGTNKDLYLYNKRNLEPKETVALNQISNISNVLREDLKFAVYNMILTNRGEFDVKGLVSALKADLPVQHQDMLEAKIEDWLQRWVNDGIIQQHWNTFSLI